MIVYVLETFPNLTETFILNEIVELKRRGLEIQVLATQKGTTLQEGSGHLNIGNVIYFKPFFSKASLYAHLYAIRSFKLRYFILLSESLIRSKSNLSHLNAFLKSIYFLFCLRHFPVKLIHAHFISFPASVASIMSSLSGVSYSCSAHANDIYKGNPQDIKEKIRKASFIITCTLANKRYLDILYSYDDKSKIVPIYHGIDIKQWPLKGCNFERFTTKTEIKVLTVGRLVEKKGIKFVIEAIKLLLNKGISVRYYIVGDGPLRIDLEKQVRSLGLGHVVEFFGAQPQSLVKQFYNMADFFILPCNITVDGDRDGLPNVLLEAMATGLPIISTNISGISELLIDQVSGIVVPPLDSPSISEALLTLSQSPQMCRSLSENGRRIIEERFSIDISTDLLIERFTSKTK